MKSPKTETLVAGKKEHYGGGIDATSSSVDVKVECEGRKAGGLFVGAGLLALIGLGAAVAIGKGVGDNPGVASPSTPVR